MSGEFELTLRDIAAAIGARWSGGEGTVTGVSTDSRSVRAGELFVAIIGEKFDAHRFADGAVRRGAAAVMSSREIPELGVPQLVVTDTRLAFGAIGKLWRARFTAPTIALTGSNGKTTVKEMLRAILVAHAGDAHAVHVTEGNLNNDIGVPQTMLAQRAHHRFAVYEMGMNHLGEIAHLTRLVEPEVALVIMAGTAHLGELGSREAIAEAKGEIFGGLKAGGAAIINADDRFAGYWRGLVEGRRVVDFGLHGSAAVTGVVEGDALTIRHEGKTQQVRLAVPGAHNRVNALAAAAAALSLGVPLTTIGAAMGDFAGVPGRLKRFAGHNSATIIDDTYNANPDSAKAAIDVLAAMKPPRFLVMGDMGELGADAPAMHREVGAYARQAGIDALFALGDNARGMAETFGAGATHFTDLPSLLAALKARAGRDTAVLVKGSRFMQMERVVAELVPGYHGHH
jgi:UDP-N-acetylmuramoyl-tripeptide--D-alanyl-D-alanine ligase